MSNIHISELLIQGKYQDKLLTRHEHKKSLLDLSQLKYGIRYIILVYRKNDDGSHFVKFFGDVRLDSKYYIETECKFESTGCKLMGYGSGCKFSYETTYEEKADKSFQIYEIFISKPKKPSLAITQGCFDLFDSDYFYKKYVLEIYNAGIFWGIEKLIWLGHYKNPVYISYKFRGEQVNAYIADSVLSGRRPISYEHYSKKEDFELHGSLFSLLPKDIIKVIIKFVEELSNYENDCSCRKEASKKRKKIEN